MAIFTTWQGYWRFAQAITWKQRFIRDQETEDFLANVLATSEKRTVELSAGDEFWRAQIGEDMASEDEYLPLPAERMTPLADRAVEGRVNPKGIPCLYLATDPNTAIAEVRPWVGASVSVARFLATERLRVVDCTQSKRGIYLLLREPAPERREEAVWHAIDRAFSQPVLATEDHAHYAPTQVLAELFKAHGFDGVRYNSSVGPGQNLALFDLKRARIVSCHLHTIKALHVEAVESGTRHWSSPPGA